MARRQFLAGSLLLLAAMLLQPSPAAPESNSGVLVVFIFDQHCKQACKEVRPAMQELRRQYGSNMSYAELDTSREFLEETKKTAKDPGLRLFVKAELYN